MATISQHGRGWRAQIRRQGHQAISKSGFASKGEARIWARRTEGEIDAGKRIEPGRVTFAEIVDAYLEATRSKLAGRSKAAALRMLRQRLGRLRLGQITPQAVLRFAAERETEGAGPATLRADLSYVGTCLRHGCTAVGADPAQALVALAQARATLGHADRVASSNERDRRPTDAELQTLFAYWRRHPGTLLPMIDLTLFAICTGMRLGEILRLDRTELDLAGRTILVVDRKHPRAKKGNHQRVPLLSGPFTSAGQVIDPLAIIQRQPTTARLIFPYNGRSVSTAFYRAVKKCGIDDLHYHDLRHHACSLLFEANYAIQEVALVSDHRDWNMLRRSTKLKPETLHRALPENVVSLPAVGGATGAALRDVQRT